MARQQNSNGRNQPALSKKGISESMDEINQAASKHDLYTTSMLAVELDLSEGTIRNRITKLKLKPAARIFPKGRGRATMAYDKQALKAIEDAAEGEVRIDMLR